MGTPVSQVCLGFWHLQLSPIPAPHPNTQPVWTLRSRLTHRAQGPWQPPEEGMVPKQNAND